MNTTHRRSNGYDEGREESTGILSEAGRTMVEQVKFISGTSLGAMRELHASPGGEKYRSQAKIAGTPCSALMGTRDELRRGMMSQMKDRAIFTIVFE